MWHNTEFETVQNSRGQFVVVFQNYRYGKDKQRFEQGQPVMSWRCTSKNSGCMARIATRGYNLLKAFGRPHNHPPPVPCRKNLRKKIKKERSPTPEYPALASVMIL
ncbi:predicted protein [Culex quinquefasciatus]|uniref:Predicted protein n=1 Tax=Culex quinquefasciatus TaxID=7176 RepID=B0W388_CULQU|nr:predicted protein [Culex quinquefasciatus]|eukprot:XP_001843172.1 predicted protein [Culex quinquefasciatus]